MEDDEWDNPNNDWDKKARDNADEIKNQQEQQANQNQDRKQDAPQLKFGDDDGNYFEAIEESKRLKQNQQIPSCSSKGTKSRDTAITFQPYSSKDLRQIRNYAKRSSKFRKTHHMIYETFGQLERFLLTHEQNLAHETIVELVIIDVTLLQIPNHNHNRHLLENLAKITSFWSQIIVFVGEFLESKHKDPQFLLLVDMNGFFENLELLLHSLLTNNIFNTVVESFFNDLLKLMDGSKSSDWNKADRLRRLQVDFKRNVAAFRIYDVSSENFNHTNYLYVDQSFQIYPNLHDLTTKVEKGKLNANIIEGEYESVSQYLQIQLPLLKEDFISKLRDGCKQLKSAKSREKLSNKVIKTPNFWIHPNVQIIEVKRSSWIQQCRLYIVQLKLNSIDPNRQFLTGQMLCFTSSEALDDLVVAVVLKREVTDQTVELVIEIIRTENLDDIRSRTFIMIEPTIYFLPYHSVFNVMKNLNDLNFPFSQQILKLRKAQTLTDYKEKFTYKGFTFKVENINDWPDKNQLSLELTQMKAIQKAVTRNFSIIQGM